MIRTIRFRVTAIATILAGLLLTALALGVIALLHSHLRENLDDNLLRRADALSALAANGSAIPVDEDFIVHLVGVGTNKNPNGDAGDIGDIGDIGRSPDWAAARGEISTVRSLGPSHANVRVITRTIAVPDGPATLQIATRFEDVNEPIGVLARSLLVAIPLAVALLAALVWWLTGRTLRPVEAIRSELEDITVSDLRRRVPVPATGDEIHRLATTMNTTLERLEGSVDRQQRFVADASHELRTPLARMRAALEVDVASPDTADLTRTHQSVLDDTVALQHLVDDLLFLARSDARALERVVGVTVDLDVVVGRELQPVVERGRRRVVATGVGAVQTRGQADQLGRAIRNVIENAERHARSTITVELVALGDRAVLTISDDGPGIPPERRDAVFERFTRLDEARSSRDGGTGLGLAIARDIIERHHGTIGIDGDDGARITINLPGTLPGTFAGPTDR